VTVPSTWDVAGGRLVGYQTVKKLS